MVTWTPTASSARLESVAGTVPSRLIVALDCCDTNFRDSQYALQLRRQRRLAWHLLDYSAGGNPAEEDVYECRATAITIPIQELRNFVPVDVTIATRPTEWPLFSHKVHFASSPPYVDPVPIFGDWNNPILTLRDTSVSPMPAGLVLVRGNSVIGRATHGIVALRNSDQPDNNRTSLVICQYAQGDQYQRPLETTGRVQGEPHLTVAVHQGTGADNHVQSIMFWLGSRRTYYPHPTRRVRPYVDIQARPVMIGGEFMWHLDVQEFDTVYELHADGGSVLTPQEPMSPDDQFIDYPTMEAISSLASSKP